MMFEHQRIEFDNFAMAVKHVNCKLSRNMVRYGGDLSILDFLRHLVSRSATLRCPVLVSERLADEVATLMTGRKPGSEADHDKIE